MSVISRDRTGIKTKTMGLAFKVKVVVRFRSRMRDPGGLGPGFGEVKGEMVRNTERQAPYYWL